MKIVSVHSHKGGAGKTSLSLMAARGLAEANKRVVLLDLDFLGAGIWPAISATTPTRYIEEVFTAVAGSTAAPTVADLVVEHRLDGEGLPISLILNTGSPPSAAHGTVNRKRDDLHSQTLGLLEVERQAGIIERGLKVLLSDLEGAGYDYAILDCHPTLEEISEAVFRVQMDQPEENSIVVLMTSPDRADLYGLLWEANRRTRRKRPRTLKVDRTIFVVNRVESDRQRRPYGTDLASLAELAEELTHDPLVGGDAPALLHVLRPVHYCRILWDPDLASSAFAIRSDGQIPRWSPGLLSHNGTSLCTELFGEREG